MMDVSYPRNSLKMPEQFLHRLNKERKAQDLANNQVKVWSKDNKSVIIIGTQPDNSWGIKEYTINGDQFVFANTVL